MKITIEIDLDKDQALDALLEILGMEGFDDGVLAVIAVKGAADHGDVLIRVACHAGIDAVLAADAQHIARARALTHERHVAQIERRVAVDLQTVSHIIGALRHDNRIGHVGCRVVSRVIQRVLYRAAEAVIVDEVLSDVDIALLYLRSRRDGDRRH